MIIQYVKVYSPDTKVLRICYTVLFRKLTLGQVPMRAAAILSAIMGFPYEEPVTEAWW